jgi:16S rRNA processing protein RimM
MILENEIVKIGRFRKPHGVRGEIVFSFTDDSFDTADFPFLISPVEGIFVPFRLTEYRFTSDETAIVSIDGLDTAEKVRFLTNLEVYFPKKYLAKTSDHETTDWNRFAGYEMVDENLGVVGNITAIDSSTLNTLFVINNRETELLAPAVDEFVVKIDEIEKKLFVNLPEGMFN